MRSKEEVLEEARRVRAQGMASEGILRRAMSDRLKVLLWVLGDERVPKLTVSDEVKKLMECVW